MPILAKIILTALVTFMASGFVLFTMDSTDVDDLVPDRIGNVLIAINLISSATVIIGALIAIWIYK